MRTITLAKARARLEKLLRSLGRKGPVTIACRGWAMAVLAAPVRRGLPKHRAVAETHLAELARCYSNGTMAWRDIAAETGIAFGELLAELGRQGLEMPRVTAAKTPEQAALFEDILRRASQH